MKHTLKWFTNRIGKTIYRGAVPCKCKKCTDVEKTGLKIWDGIENEKQVAKRDFHARYLHDCQGMLGIGYFDKPVKG